MAAQRFAVPLRPAAFALAGLLASAATVHAQGGREGGTTTSESTRQSVVFNPATVTFANISAFSTTVIGRLTGGAALFNQTYAQPFASTVVQGGVAAARLAVTTAGGPGVMITGPALTASSTVTASTSVTTYRLAATTMAANDTRITFGPDTIQTGALTVCSGIAGLPSSTRPSCGPGTPVAYVLAPGETNFNIIRETIFTVDETTQTTTTTTTTETYTLVGTVQAVGQAHGVAGSALIDQSQRFARRLLDEAGGTQPGWTGGPFGQLATASLPPGVAAYAPGQRSAAAAPTRWVTFANAYGWRGQRSASGGVPGDRRNAAGVEGGIGYDVTDNLRIGAGASTGRLDVKLSGGRESLGIDLTEIGVLARYRDGGFHISGAATHGFGRIGTDGNVAGFATTASYRARTWSLAGETGYRFNLSALQVTPHLGAQWQRVRTGAFSETGLFALTSPGQSQNRAKGWAGVSLLRNIEVGAINVALFGYGRVFLSNGETANLSASFVGTATPLTITGPRTGRAGFEGGAAIGLQPTPNIDVVARYDAQVRDRLWSHTASAGLRVRW
jgi:uncharacterized protein with beta-barrel porin domain